MNDQIIIPLPDPDTIIEQAKYVLLSIGGDPADHDSVAFVLNLHTIDFLQKSKWTIHGLWWKSPIGHSYLGSLDSNKEIQIYLALLMNQWVVLA